MNTRKYNGWANRATWNVALWLGGVHWPEIAADFAEMFGSDKEVA